MEKLKHLILLTGASGYVGGRLLGALESAGHRIRCVTRHPKALRPRVTPETEVVTGDVLDANSLAPHIAGVHTAYYLVHSMASSSSFEEQDRRGAESFATAARNAGVKRLVYLGGLGSGTELSPHLRSRHEVGRILRESGVPTIEFRASITIGSGTQRSRFLEPLIRSSLRSFQEERKKFRFLLRPTNTYIEKFELKTPWKIQQAIW